MRGKAMYVITGRYNRLVYFKQYLNDNNCDDCPSEIYDLNINTFISMQPTSLAAT